MTEEEVDKAAARLEAENNKKEARALEKFNKGPVPKLDWMMDQLIEEMLARVATIRSGSAPDALGGFTRDELARILSTRTYCEYGMQSFMRNFALKAQPDAHPAHYSQSAVARCWTPQFGHWRQLVTALIEYLHAAAILAKHINPASSAARLYVRAWRIASTVFSRDKGYSQATRSEALAIVGLERVAADLLWADIEVDALPPFKKARRAKAGV